MATVTADLVGATSDPYGLTEDEQAFKRTVHEFVAKEIAPTAAHFDETEEFPRENVGKMAEVGLMGLLVPEEYGGAGATNLLYAIASEEVSWACAAHAAIIGANNSLVCDPLLHFGTEAQKRAYLPRLATAEIIGSYCLSEPSSGSDAAALTTNARRDGDSWVLNGAKSWITNGGESGLYLVYARTNPDAPKAKGITAFLVEADTPGLRIGRKERKMGIRASATTQVFFEDCRVPADAVLGTVDEGFKIAMATLDGGRIGVAAQGLGIAQRALDETVKYTKERHAFGRPIADFQGLQWKMADMATQIEASRLLIYRAARLRDAGVPFGREASMAKLFATEMAMKCAHQAVQLHGGYGYSREYPVEKLFRDAKITEIYEGTSEIQRLVIARYLLQ
jgi:alkylation response protein AidB-like acyl-CoA dehydrogenase